MPLLATGRNYSRALVISNDFSSASFNFSLTIVDDTLESLRLYISSTSSRINPLELFNRFKILSSFVFKFALFIAISTTSYYRVNSISGISSFTTSVNNCSSKPSSVTVKFITVTLKKLIVIIYQICLMKISGKKCGLGNLLTKNNLKLGSTSISPESPIFTIFLLPYILYCLSNNGSSTGSNVS